MQGLPAMMDLLHVVSDGMGIGSRVGGRETERLIVELSDLQNSWRLIRCLTVESVRACMIYKWHNVLIIYWDQMTNPWLSPIHKS